MATTSDDAVSHPGSVSEPAEVIGMGAPLGGGAKAQGPVDSLVRDLGAPLANIHEVIVRTENNTRRLISLAIVFVFVAWALAGGVYLMVSAGNVQVLLDGSAFISGPLGVVIGYYFGVGDDPKRK